MSVCSWGSWESEFPFSSLFNVSPTHLPQSQSPILLDSFQVPTDISTPVSQSVPSISNDVPTTQSSLSPIGHSSPSPAPISPSPNPSYIPISSIHIDLPIPPAQSTIPSNTHPMLTRSKHGITKPKAFITYASNELEPTSFKIAITNLCGSRQCNMNIRLCSVITLGH